MTLNNDPWPYLIVRMIAITIVVTPFVNGLYTALLLYLTDLINQSDREGDFFTNLYIFWGYSLYFTWAFLGFVLVPYNLIYYYNFKKKHIALKFFLFFTLTVVTFLLFTPSVNLEEGEIKYYYLRIFFNCLFLTLAICPLSNLALNKIMEKANPNSPKAETEI